MKTITNQLENENNFLKSQLENLLAENQKLKTDAQHWQSKYEHMLEQFKLAQLRKFAPSSEKNPQQQDLFDESDRAVENDDTQVTKGSITVAAHERKKKGQPKRTPLPAHFPRERIEYDVADNDKYCDCGHDKTKIGEDITEQLDVVPPQFKVIQHVRPKYACKHCQQGVAQSPMPKLFLPKSIAAPGLVAFTVIQKYVDHVPLYRQEDIWKRQGVNMPRNTVCGWLMQAAEKLEPLMAYLREDILRSGYVQADETPVQVLKEPDRKDTQLSFMWLYRGNAPNYVAILFDYQETREGRHAKNFLQDFKGYLQTDGYLGYRFADHTKGIIHLGCMAHGRRPFAELVKLANTTGKAHQALSYITKLYRIEHDARDLKPDARTELRLKNAKPLLDDFKAWLEKSVRSATLKGKLGKAIQYLLDHWQELNHYLLDGRLEIDNNLVENDIRPFAIGRKNWTFHGSPKGANAGAIFYSLLMTCKANQIEPFMYLNYLFNKIPHCMVKEDYRSLLPYNIDKHTLLDFAMGRS